MLKNFLILLAISICWGLSIVFIKVEVTAECPFTVMTERSVIAFLFMLGAALVARKNLSLSFENIRKFFLLSLLGIVIPWIALGHGQQLIDTGLASALNSMQVIFTYLIVVLITRSIGWSFAGIAGVVVGTLGLFVIIGVDIFFVDDSKLSGVLLMAGCFLSFSIFGVVLPKMARGVDTVVSICWLFGISSVIFAVMAIMHEDPFDINFISQHTLAAVSLGVISTAVPYWGYEILLKRAGALMGSMIAYFVPTFGIIFGALMIGDELGIELIVGILIIFVGVYFLNRAILRHRVKDSD